MLRHTNIVLWIYLPDRRLIDRIDCNIKRWHATNTVTNDKLDIRKVSSTKFLNLLFVERKETSKNCIHLKWETFLALVCLITLNICNLHHNRKCYTNVCIILFLVYIMYCSIYSIPIPCYVLVITRILINSYIRH